ncbi:hypothetical protein ACFVJ8_07135 [Streptomyces yangpuensis]|uniref:hypothetical protein n=1 Tax=Streptomyces yangpuensis TaxID=1648182 RepID=UPI0036349252
MLKTARHQDAAEALGREWMFLNVLAAVGSFPSPVAKFQHGEDHCIVMEFVQGARPGPLLLGCDPFAGPGPDVVRSRNQLRIFLTVLRGPARAVRAAHDRGVALVGLTASDVLVERDTYEVSVVGLRSCRLAGAGNGDARSGPGTGTRRGRGTPPECAGSPTHCWTRRTSPATPPTSARRCGGWTSSGRSSCSSPPPASVCAARTGTPCWGCPVRVCCAVPPIT